MANTIASHAKISDSCRDLLHCILQVDVAKRITVPGILNHEWCAACHCPACCVVLVFLRRVLCVHMSKHRTALITR